MQEPSEHVFYVRQRTLKGELRTALEEGECVGLVSGCNQILVLPVRIRHRKKLIKFIAVDTNRR